MKIDNKVLLLTFHESMNDLCLQALKELGLAIPVLSLRGLWTKEVKAAIKEQIDNGIEIIISRGILADYIRNTFSVKVVEIVISSYDVLKALYPYANSQKRIGFIEGDAFIVKVREVAELLGLNISYYKVKSMAHFEDIASLYEQAKNDGIEIVVGGAFGLLWGDLTGLPCINIESSKNTIIDCLKEAMIAYELLYEQEYEKDYLNTILNHSEEGIISVGTDGKIKVMNQSSKKILNLSRRDVIDQPIGAFFKEYQSTAEVLNKRIDRNVLVQYNQSQCMLSRVPILVEEEVRGALFFLTKTESLQESERQLRLKLRSKGLTAKRHFEDIYSQSPGMKKIIDTSILYSKKDSTVLITGETGCGKEFFAQSIHNASNRSAEAFLAVNCAAFPSNLLESELFGYVEGSFTGARASGKAGIFEIAHKGTLFLDEIAEIDLQVQVQLLRVLQEKEVRRIGDDKVIPVDVRIIAATNKDLKREVEEGRFRRDLYYRLNILNIAIPPLRERVEDLPMIIHDLITEKNEALGCKVTKFDKKLLSHMREYRWPGNIRELSNVVEKILVLTQSGVAEYDEVYTAVRELETEEPDQFAIDDTTLTMEEIERASIEARLAACGNNKVKTAKSLGIGKATLFRKIEKYRSADSKDS
jgi:transcriptional regulator with PAS, ATPase and Fis domain